MQRTLLLIICFFCFIKLQAQNISGIVNSYHKVLVPEEISAGNEVAISLDDASALVEGQRVLMIQIKGAIVNTSESDSFGDIESLNNAGNYEFSSVSKNSQCCCVFLYTSLTKQDFEINFAIVFLRLIKKQYNLKTLPT